jgi:hypothetical protein
MRGRAAIAVSGPITSTPSSNTSTSSSVVRNLSPTIIWKRRNDHRARATAPS